MKTKTSLAVIIPMHNEELGLEACVRRVMGALRGLPIQASLLAVNDGSSDQTSPKLKRLSRKYGRLIVVDLKRNQGYGGAVTAGVREALKRRFDFGLVMDSDLTNDPKDIPRFLTALGPEVGCVKASRYVPGGRAKGVPLYRRLISKAGNTISSTLFAMGVKDTTNGFALYRLEVFRGVAFQEKSFSVILEMLYHLKRSGTICREIPVTLTSRAKGFSSFVYRPVVFWDYFKWALKAALI